MRSGFRDDGTAHPSLGRSSRRHTFRQGEQIVVPLSVGISANVFAARPIHHADIGPDAANEGEKRIGPSFDRSDDLLSGPVPVFSTQMGDAVVGVLARLLADTTNAYICHGNILSSVLALVDSRADTNVQGGTPYVNYNIALVLLTSAHQTTRGVDVWLIDTPSPRVQCPCMAGVGAAEQVYKAFGAQVRARREVLGLTQLQLSKHIGLTRGSVANIEAGRQSVLLHQFLDIATALQQTPDQLLPTRAETQPAREQPEMPESVLNAIEIIKKSAGSRTPSRQ